MDKPSQLRKIDRRKFILSALLAAPMAFCGDACLVEPTNVIVKRHRVGLGPCSHRLVHFSDIHHKGDRRYLQSVVSQINGLEPDFVCFTGDMVEEPRFLPEALEIIAGIKAPLFGVPGNHEFHSHISFVPVRRCFAATGGAWLMDEHRLIAGDQINLIGTTCKRWDEPRLPLHPTAKNLLLMHYPAHVKKLGNQRLDLALAGHSHGGQVRIPGLGAIFLPYGVDQYDLGLYETPAGPLHVNPGIGFISEFDCRFNCPPEITVIEI